MNCRGIFFIILVFIISEKTLGQRRVPPPPPPPPPSSRIPKVVVKTTNNVSTSSTTKATATSTPKNTVINKEWKQVFKGKIYTNIDSATLLYQSLKEQQVSLENDFEKEFKVLNASFVKSSFETSYEFEDRKTKAITDFKNKKNELMSAVLSQIVKFESSAYLSKTNRFKLSLSDKDYNADAWLWKIKIIDVVSNTSDFVEFEIKPAEAKRLWEIRDQIKLNQVIDFTNPNALLVWLSYPYEVSTSPIIFAYVAKAENSGEHINNEYKVSGSKTSEEESDKIFTSVQIPSTFPGGNDAWAKFLSRNLNRDLPVENGAPAGNYRVTVSFVVARDGSISDVKAENDPGYGTANEAVRVIQNGPKWTPAEQNGKKVIYRHRQVLVFQVTED
jgi:hypothetical protein